MSESQYQEYGPEVLGRIAGQLRARLEELRPALEALAPSEERDADPVLDGHAAALHRACCRLLRLSGNLAGLGREPRLANGDVAALARQVAERARMPAEMLGLKLEFQCGRPSHIAAMDAALLERLLLNLLSNAFRFTPRGGTVAVEVRLEGERVLLTVSDTGPGLRGPVFDRCLHGPALEAPPHGLGLGLPLCREIARVHGGSLVLSSREGGGTAATAAIPNRKLAGREPEPFAVDLYGGYNSTLVELADALPGEAFAQRFWD